MHKVFIALTVVVLTALQTGCAASHARQANTSEEKAVMLPVHQFTDGFNAGDIKKALAACTDSMSIIDEFPPHEWHGAGTAAKWVNDYEADAKKNGLTDAVVTLGVPRHIDITGDRAYVVVPADYAFKLKGKPAKETGSILTIALQNSSAGWRITGWAWTKN
jgi:hypothetical protein